MGRHKFYFVAMHKTIMSWEENLVCSFVFITHQFYGIINKLNKLTYTLFGTFF